MKLRRSIGMGALAVVATLPVLAEPLPGGTLDPTTIPKFVSPLLIPRAMPRADKVKTRGMKNIDYYEIAVRQFDQQVLPPGYPATTVWGYGALQDPTTFHFPSFTIEAKWRMPVRVRWVNQLVDANGDFLPHLLPVDQTLHWANPSMECAHGMPRTDCRGTSQAPYAGPVPMIVHVHGAETDEWSDGYPEAWYLPAARNLPAGWATAGSFFGTFRTESPLGADWAPGSTVFQYPNDQPATTLWYHDHTLGMTRQNVYAGPAGFYVLRGGPGDMVTGTLPGPAPALGDPPGTKYYEIPIAIQDRAFNADGSLFYPSDRAFFEGLEPAQLQIPFIPDAAIGGASDVSPIWNPEYFGNTIVVNGNTWPYLDVEPRRYRLRLLNGCASRFLILRMSDGSPFWQIGAEQGFLPAPVRLSQLLMGPAERADVIVDFTGMAPGTEIVLQNVAPDEPYGGGEPGDDFEPADPGTTGQVMKFRVVRGMGHDPSTPPDRLLLPAPPVLGPEVAVRRISLNEEESSTVFVTEDEDGNVVLDPDGEPFGPTEALLGTVNPDGTGNPLTWSDATTENVATPGDTEVWEIHNFTMDAHPIHVHLVQFQVVNRESMDGGDVRAPEPWETGFKDTVIAYPDEITRVKARFALPGLFVWHCHILEHEDNEMMRPFCVGDSPACRQHNGSGMGH